MRTGTLFRYIFNRAVRMWTAALVSFVLLVMISRFFSSISMFAEHDTDLTTMLAFMAYSVPQVVYWVLPFSLCLGILAVQALFSRHLETIAMQTCSVTNAAIYLPYLIVGLIATVVMAGVSFQVYPLSQRQADRIEDVYIRNRDVHGSFSVTGGRFKVAERIYYVGHLDIQAATMQNITCYSLNSGRLDAIVTARSARWNGEAWSAEGMKTIHMSQEGIVEEPPGETLPLKRGPEDLVMARARPEVLTIGELRRYLLRLRADGIPTCKVATFYHSRISFAAAPLIMVLLVLPFGMRFPRTGGIARGIAFGIVLGLVYWALHSGCVSLGQAGLLPPMLASWTANLAALGVGSITLYRKRGEYG